MKDNLKHQPVDQDETNQSDAAANDDHHDLNGISIAALRLTFPDLVVEPEEAGSKRRVVRSAPDGRVLGWIHV